MQASTVVVTVKKHLIASMETLAGHVAPRLLCLVRCLAGGMGILFMGLLRFDAVVTRTGGGAPSKCSLWV
jgi:hypothetical protein